MDKLKSSLGTVAKLFARVYNSIPSRLKVVVFSSSSVVASGVLGLLIADIQALQISNKYLIVIVGGSIPIINELQKVVVEAGTKILATEGDKKTLQALDIKIEQTETLKNLSK